jgi:hypothetical protein
MDIKEELKIKSEDVNIKNDDDKSGINTDNEPANKKAKLLKNKDNLDEEDIDEDNEAEFNIKYEIPEEGFIYPLEYDASDMLKETEFNGYFPSVTERYLTPYYQIDVQKPGDDICIRIHSNRICMISLAPSHTIFQENKTIKSCNFKVSEKLDRTKNKVSGKSKHGAQPLQSNSNLCYLTCDDGSTYTIKCCMIGKLVEVNERLIENPELLKEEPHFGGYIAIVLPNLKHLEKTRETLLNKERYEEAIKKREENKVKEKEKIEEMDVNIAETAELKDIAINKVVEDKQNVDMDIIDKDNDNTNNLSNEKKDKNIAGNDEMEIIES